MKIPFNKHQFSVITFEHDYYIDENPEIRELSRNYLKSLGYSLLVNDVSIGDNSPFEDWWINPTKINKDIISKMTYISSIPNRVDNYMFYK